MITIHSYIDMRYQLIIILKSSHRKNGFAERSKILAEYRSEK